MLFKSGIQFAGVYAFSSVKVYGGAQKLVDLKLLKQPVHITQQPVTLALNWRQRCDYELIVNGALTPLDHYMDRQTYESVCEKTQLPSGLLFPIPFVLEIPSELQSAVHKSKILQLVDNRDGSKLALVEVTDLWEPKLEAEIAAYGGDPEHPEIERLNSQIRGKHLYAGARFLQVQSIPTWGDYNEYRLKPAEVRDHIASKGWKRTVAFQTRNPMHFAHIELVKRAAKENDCSILLQPVSGPTKDGDVDYVTRMKAYHVIINQFKKEATLLNLLPLAMRMGGPREALTHCIIRQNYGASHFIIGRDHAGPGSNSKGVDFYAPYEARDAVISNAKHFDIKPVPFDMVVYVEQDKKYYLSSEVPKGVKALKLSGTEVRKRLREGIEIPDWFSPPEVVSILRKKFESDKWSEQNKKFLNQTPKQIIKHALETFGKDVAISFSGAEDVLLIEYAKQTGLPFRVFSLDTGRLHPETYKLFEQVEKHYGIKIEYCFPEAEDVQNLVRKKGMFSFYKDGHQECCGVRKVRPLRKILSTLKAWITGVRKDQSVTRVDVPFVLIDDNFKGLNNSNLIKFNPLSEVTSQEVWQEIRQLSVPYNQLHEKGFVSIGCEPCTKPTMPNQHEREGRWWWEEATQKECGLHAKKCHSK